MRIFFLTNKLNFETSGGSVYDIHLKAKRLIELGYQVTVVTVFSKANKINVILPYPVKEEIINSKSAGLFHIQRGGLAVLKKYEKEADIFHIEGHNLLYSGGLYRLLGGKVPVVAFFNHRLNCIADPFGNLEKVPFLKLIKKKLRLFLEHRLGMIIANRIDYFIFNTPQVEKLYFDFGLAMKKSHSVLEDCVDMEGIRERENMTEEKLAWRFNNKKTVTIFCSGRMLKEKGFDLIIKAFSLLKDKENYRVIMCGSGPDEQRLHQLVKDLNLQKFFHFPGWIKKEELVELFRRSHIFIYPKWWMEYGSALLMEIMAFGLPCIVPGGGALEWLAKDGALTFKPEDEVDLSNKIEQLARDSNLMIRQAKINLERVNDLGYKVLTAKLENIFKSVVSENK